MKIWKRSLRILPWKIHNRKTKIMIFNNSLNYKILTLCCNNSKLTHSFLKCHNYHFKHKQFNLHNLYQSKINKFKIQEYIKIIKEDLHLKINNSNQEINSKRKMPILRKTIPKLIVIFSHLYLFLLQSQSKVHKCHNPKCSRILKVINSNLYLNKKEDLLEMELMKIRCKCTNILWWDILTVRHS